MIKSRKILNFYGGLLLNTRKYIHYLNGNKNCVGEYIKDLREKKNVSRQQLSNKLMILGIDISSDSIFDIENGTRTVVDYELCAIAKVLNIPTDLLLKNFKGYLDTI